MLSLKALRNQERLKRIIDENMKSKPVKIIPCNENAQVYSWQRTNKKSQIRPKEEFQKQLKSFNIKTRR
jgi:hypothetical protein